MLSTGNVWLVFRKRGSSYDGAKGPGSFLHPGVSRVHQGLHPGSKHRIFLSRGTVCLTGIPPGEYPWRGAPFLLHHVCDFDVLIKRVASMYCVNLLHCDDALWTDQIVNVTLCWNLTLVNTTLMSNSDIGSLVNSDSKAHIYFMIDMNRSDHN